MLVMFMFFSLCKCIGLLTVPNVSFVFHQCLLYVCKCISLLTVFFCSGCVYSSTAELYIADFSLSHCDHCSCWRLCSVPSPLQRLMQTHLKQFSFRAFSSSTPKLWKSYHHKQSWKQTPWRRSADVWKPTCSPNVFAPCAQRTEHSTSCSFA